MRIPRGATINGQSRREIGHLSRRSWFESADLPRRPWGTVGRTFDFWEYGWEYGWEKVSRANSATPRQVYIC